VALLYIGGILLGECFRAPLPALFAVCFVLAVAAILWTKARIYLLTALLAAAGWLNMNRQTDIISPNDLRRVIRQEIDTVAVRGTLHNSPVARIFEMQGRELWRSTVMIDATEVRAFDGWRPAYGRIIATVPGVLESNYFIGQSVEAMGELGPPRGPLAEGLFDPRSHYKRLGIYYQLRTKNMDAWKIVPSTPPASRPLADRFTSWARRTLALGLGPEDAPLRLLWTLVLDWKAPLTENVEEPFMRAGTFHIFAVDGLRIGLLAGILIALLRAFQLPRAFCGILVIPIIWFYAGITGWPPSAVRAAIMMTIVIMGWAGRRPADLVNSLFAAALIILLWDPQQLFLPGFQLSFLVVLCIALILPPIQEFFKSLLFKKDPFLPEALQPRWPVPLYAAALFVIDTCAMSVAAWLGSMPLSAYYFHLFSPIGVPANILVVPITALALMSSMGSILTGAWLPGAAILFNHASWFFMNCIIELSQWAAHWRPGSFNISTPMPVTFVLYYLALFSAAAGWLFKPRLKWPLAAVMMALAACWLTERLLDMRAVHLHFLPLAGGAAVFADDPRSGRNFLFDCGNASEAEMVTKPFLRAHGVNTLDGFALTVGHVQDGGGARVITTNFSVARLFLNPHPGRSAAYREVINAITLSSKWPDESRATANNWSAFNAAPVAHLDNADDGALVFWREIKGHSVLLLSSLGRGGQESLMEQHSDLRADIVVCGLPAQDEPLCDALLGQLQPKLIVIIDSSYPAERRASAKLRERLAACKIPALYCHDAGAVKLSLGNDGWDLRDPGGRALNPQAGNGEDH
jgi:ComEC/Rec2-related protein